MSRVIKLPSKSFTFIIDDDDKVTFIIKPHIDPNAIDEQRVSILHIVCLYGDADSAEILIKMGANVNAEDIDGTTPLHCAVIGGSLRIIRLLIISGADVWKDNNYGISPIMLAKNEYKNKEYKILMGRRASI